MFAKKYLPATLIIFEQDADVPSELRLIASYYIATEFPRFSGNGRTRAVFGLDASSKNDVCLDTTVHLWRWAVEPYLGIGPGEEKSLHFDRPPYRITIQGKPLNIRSFQVWKSIWKVKKYPSNGRRCMTCFSGKSNLLRRGSWRLIVESQRRWRR